MKKIVIAIDGPAGSGKSTIAKELAKKMDITHIDSGSMYRATAFYMLEQGVDINNEKEVLARLDEVNLSFEKVSGKQVIFLNGENVEYKIRNNEVSTAASIVSLYGKLREKLVAIQRNMGENESVIMDGRDIGTVVFKDADLKIFLVCDVRERARRRFKEFKAKDENITLDMVVKELKERDKRDESRANSPLKKADDAIEVDSSNMSVREVVDSIDKIAGERWK